MFTLNFFPLSYALPNFDKESRVTKLTGVQDLEQIDYYCPDCKAKSKCGSSDLVKRQKKTRYVRNVFFCSFHLVASEFLPL